MTAEATYSAIFDRIAVDLQAVPNLTVKKGETFNYNMTFPLALINPGRMMGSQEADDLIGNDLEIEVICIIRETVPNDWFTDVIAVMWDVSAAVMADRTLNGNAEDVIRVNFAPAEIRFGNKLYYGGVIRFRAIFWSTD